MNHLVKDKSIWLWSYRSVLFLTHITKEWQFMLQQVSIFKMSTFVIVIDCGRIQTKEVAV